MQLLKISALTILLLAPFIFVLNVNAKTSSTTTCDISNPKTPFCPITKDNYDASMHNNITVTNTINTLGCLGEGFSITGQGCANYTFKPGQSDQPGLQSYLYNPSGGALGTAFSGIAFLYTNPPASGVQYLAESIQNFGLAKPAYAQVFGSGYNVIQPIEKLWRVMRDIAFLGFIVIAIVIGIMIMMRKQLDQRTVVGIQQALPGLVVSLVLVYFSFFISGLIIDVAFVGSRLAGTALIAQLNPTPANTTPAQIVNNALNNINIFGFFMQFIGGPNVPIVGSGSLGSASNEISRAVGDGFLKSIGARGAMSLVGSIALGLSCLPAIVAGLAAGGVPGVAIAIACPVGGIALGASAPEVIIPALIYIVLLVGLLVAMFKLFFALVSAFASIVLSVILSPLIILMSAIPGNSKAFGDWLKGLFVNVLIFPAIFVVFIFVAALLNIQSPWQLQDTVKTDQFNPLPLFGGSSPSFIQFILAYGILLAIPGIPEYIRRLFKVDEQREITRAINENIGVGRGAATWTAGAPGRLIGAFAKKP